MLIALSIAALIALGLAYYWREARQNARERNAAPQPAETDDERYDRMAWKRDFKHG